MKVLEKQKCSLLSVKKKKKKEIGICHLMLTLSHKNDLEQ